MSIKQGNTIFLKIKKKWMNVEVWFIASIFFEESIKYGATIHAIELIDLITKEGNTSKINEYH